MILKPIKVIIPTQKSAEQVSTLVAQIKETAGVPCEVFVTGIKDGSASVNRNCGLDWAKDAEWVCMVDDDCLVPNYCWLAVLAEAMNHWDVVFASSALYKANGAPAYMTGLNNCGGVMQTHGTWVCPNKRILTACCAFKPHGLRFDEHYVGSGFEDTDFCNQLAAKVDAVCKFIVCFNSRVIHNNEMKEQRNNWEWNKLLYDSKWSKSLKPLIALYKAYRGGEWFETSLESIHSEVAGVVVVAASKPWSNSIFQLPENCLEPLNRFMRRHPELPVVIAAQEGNQGAQYKKGLEVIEEQFGLTPGVLVIDTDEVWETWALRMLRSVMTEDKAHHYFRCRLHNYIKRPYWRITPQEPHRPVVGLRNAKATYSKGRFAGQPSVLYRDIALSYHHFPLVRSDETEILHKLHNTASQDGPCRSNWLEEVWNKLPAGKNIHPARGYERCWQGVEVIDPLKLPPIVRNNPLINSMLATPIDLGSSLVPSTVLQRHIAGFHKRLESMPELFDLEFWRQQESYSLIQTYCHPTDSILEVGCLNGHHCLLLTLDSYPDVIGIEFNGECVRMAEEAKAKLGIEGVSPQFLFGEFPRVTSPKKVDKILLFDVIEHMTNLQSVFEECQRIINPTGQVLVLVPKGKHYYDDGHINFWPDEETLTNHLEVYFDVIECHTVEEDKKLFARCKPRVQ